MSNISAAAVNELRKRTGLPMMKCKEALTRANGDMDKAIEIIRTEEKGVQVKMAGRETAEGRIAVYIDQAAQVGAILEMRCESAPVAKSEGFVALANEIAKQVALRDPKTVEELLAQPLAGEPGKTVNDRIAETMSTIRENMKPQRFKRLAGGPMGDYVHHDGTLGVLLQVKGERPDPQVLRDVCMHIAAAHPVPVAARREEVPADIVAKEMEIAKAKAVATGKPPQIAEKIAEGQMKTWYAENVLVEQPFVKAPEQTVGQFLKSHGLEVVTFVRYRVGEVALAGSAG